MQEISYNDLELERYKVELEPYVGGYNARGVPYEVLVYEEELVGIVVITEEPAKLIEPIGTPMSVVLIIDYTKPLDILMKFAETALRIARDRDVAYSFIDVPEKYSSLIDHFQNIGYELLAHSLRMSRSLENYKFQPSKIKGERVKREELLEFIERIKECMSGSQDNMLNIVLSNIKNLPDKFIDHWYNDTILYDMYDDDKLVGILELSPHVLNIANIGVSPNHRGKGYGKEILKFALNTLKEQGKDTAQLRVHAANDRAIHLYESFGMSRGNSYKALIWRR